jgi:hypothetical protein
MSFNHSTATNWAITTGCHAEGELRRFIDRNRYTALGRHAGWASTRGAVNGSGTWLS